MSRELFCGIDASFSGTGLIIIDQDNNIIKEQLISTNKKNDIFDIEKRIIYITKQLECILEFKNELKLTLIEGLSYGSTGDGAAQLAALNYYIRIFLLQNNINYGFPTPPALKKFVTGKGNCKKNLMLKEVYKKWGVDFTDDNICDAYSLSRLAKHIFYKNNNHKDKNNGQQEHQPNS